MCDTDIINGNNHSSLPAPKIAMYGFACRMWGIGSISTD